jgi:hypothetical protein
MMDWARKKFVQLALITGIVIGCLVVSALTVYQIWQDGRIIFALDHRYQPINSGVMVGLGLFSLVYLVLLVRKLISERSGRRRKN